MKKLLLGAIFLLPIASLAATYTYVDTRGDEQTVVAPDAATAYDRAIDRTPNSGLALTSVSLEDDMRAIADSNAETTSYIYVNSSGITDSVEAINGTVALTIAPNIASNSGVAIDSGMIDEGMRVNGVIP